MLAEVLVNLPLRRTFFYSVPPELPVRNYTRVKVNFAGRNITAFVLNLHKENSISNLNEIEIKPVLNVIDYEPIVDNRIVKMAFWMSKYYFCSVGEALFTIIPSGEKERTVSHHFKISDSFNNLTHKQREVFETIEKSIVDNKKEVFLLHGVTGSGKTEIYKWLVRTTLELGKSSIILVPEIALTPQNLERFYICFGDEVILYHSKMSPSERLYVWKKALKGEVHIVIGPRSAVFLPVQNLGLIILDEENEPSYKSMTTPRYHARDIALYRAENENLVVVLGSATPQIESYYYALNGKYTLLELNERYSTDLPDVEIIDLKKEKDERFNVISSRLFEEILGTLSRKKQVLLFLNRRGYSPVLMCKNCGFVFECPACNIALTVHKKERILNCHHCGLSKPLPVNCPSCKGIEFREMGSGTEKLESLLNSIFSGYRIERMDMDTTRKKHSYFEIIKKIKNHEVDIVVGTQMIAKGHDVENIELVGVIMPDIMLNIPDFRASERTFTLLTQVVGRAGRKGSKGKALIQTFLPEHYAIVHAKNQDYKAFFKEEIKKRKEYNYPPFVRLGRIVFRSKKKVKLEEFVDSLRKYLSDVKGKIKNCYILGPVSCPLEKLKNNYRYHIIIKSIERKKIEEVIKLIEDYFKASGYVHSIYTEVDIDPVNLL